MADQYRRWFAYERDAHDKTLASLRDAPEAARTSPTFQQAVDLLAHLVAARWLWLTRMGAVDRMPRDVFPRRVPLAELERALADMHAAWDDYLARLDQAELTRVFEYRSLEGDGFRNTVEDTLTQLFGHSGYHRGQIALLVRSFGGQPAVTDFVFWTREPLASPPVRA